MNSINFDSRIIPPFRTIDVSAIAATLKAQPLKNSWRLDWFIYTMNFVGIWWSIEVNINMAELHKSRNRIYFKRKLKWNLDNSYINADIWWKLLMSWKMPFCLQSISAKDTNFQNLSDAFVRCKGNTQRRLFPREKFTSKMNEAFCSSRWKFQERRINTTGIVALNSPKQFSHLNATTKYICFLK